MKKIGTLLLCLFFIAACTDDVGPPGPQGPQGPAGINILGNIFEVTVNFTSQNNYGTLIDFPQEIEVFETDVVLVYLLEDVIPDSTGPIDVWSLLPRTFYLDDGSQVAYNFTHTFLDVELFLAGNTNFSTLGSAFTLDQTFRIAVVPAEFAENPDINVADMQEVVQVLASQQDDFNIQKLE
ncbi:hypothetical protein [Psychroflexus salis]|uniref:Collagen-like protein n=1 Tax=Psychroflexus salis TaxID=1526574 RepID=A0A916ZSV3_9FLAO|nr:hypothetical protein [Psychroflexus salis]GGE12502.1 hypothetical protein GCM10010831_12410 [Psychroflexus salis]